MRSPSRSAPPARQAWRFVLPLYLALRAGRMEDASIALNFLSAKSAMMI